MYWIFGTPQQVHVQLLTRESCTMHLILQWYRSHLQMIFILMAYGILMWRKQLRVIHVKLLVIKGSIRFSFFRVSTIELITGAGTEIFELEYPVNIQQPHINNVVKFFRGEGANPCSLEEALVTMKVMDKAILIIG